MAGFLKVLFRNLLEGPSTDPFPFGETFTPLRVRGRVKVNPKLCVGCGVCKRVCAAGAIDIARKADKSGFTITVWRNSCCLCASCRHYCPTGAMSITNDWHSAHLESEKYECVEQQTIEYDRCDHCGAFIRPLAPGLAEKLYKENPEIEAETVRRLCAKCRQLMDARKNEGVVAEATSIEVATTGDNVEIKAADATVKQPLEPTANTEANAEATAQASPASSGVDAPSAPEQHNAGEASTTEAADRQATEKQETEK